MHGLAPPEKRLARSAGPQAIPALDGFRAIAIWLVMLSHVGLSQSVPGQFGVTLFFFLSGYLIITLLRREFDASGTISFKSFYLRRAVRILPPLAFALALAVVCSLLGLLHPLNYAGLVTDVLFLSNYLPMSGVPIGLWSLAVEEHFYFFFPAIALLCFVRGGARVCAIFCALACIATLGVRFYEAARVSDLTLINFWTHTRIDSILFGAMLACWNNPVMDRTDRMPRKWLSYALAFGLLAVTFIIRDEWFRQTWRYSLQGIALFLLFNAAIRDEGVVRRVLDSRPLQFTALLSYTLYLVHSTVVAVAENWVPALGYAPAMAAALALSFAIAWGVYVAIERPAANWRRRVERGWRSRQSARPSPAGEAAAAPFDTAAKPLDGEGEALGHLR